jgi:Neuraminidase-like domain
VDIPCYHVDALTAAASTTGNTSTADIIVAPSDGSYVIPYVLGKRVILMFAQLTSYTILQQAPATLPKPGDPTSTLTATKSWEIKLVWSGLQNGKWSHKQVTTDAVIEEPTSATPPPLDMYKFVTYTNTENLPVLGPFRSCSGSSRYLLCRQHKSQADS